MAHLLAPCPQQPAQLGTSLPKHGHCVQIEVYSLLLLNLTEGTHQSATTYKVGPIIQTDFDFCDNSVREKD